MYPYISSQQYNCTNENFELNIVGEQCCCGCLNREKIAKWGYKISLFNSVGCSLNPYYTIRKDGTWKLFVYIMLEMAMVDIHLEKEKTIFGLRYWRDFKSVLLYILRRQEVDRALFLCCVISRTVLIVCRYIRLKVLFKKHVSFQNTN